MIVYTFCYTLLSKRSCDRLTPSKESYQIYRGLVVPEVKSVME
jgi:hypothetical protein